MCTFHFKNCVPYLALIGLLMYTGSTDAQLAKGASKFLGNITTNFSVRSDFGTYWNQITGENEHKWESVESTRDKMNWGGGDAIANYARKNNIPWKFHTLIWGGQYPRWMDGLSTAEQKEEITEWFDSAAARYPDVQMIDVVNEAYMSDPNNWNAGKHAPVPFREALGGTGTTGFDWIVTSFKMARTRWPKAVLIYNDYNTLEWGNEINWIKQIIPKLIAAGAPIDAVGFQAHGLKGTSATTLKSRLDDIYSAIKLPMFITEYDIGETNDQAQLDNYKAHITVMWNHPKVAGITIWGYIYGSTWVTGTGLIKNGVDRPAMTWLKDYIKNNPNPPNDYPDILNGGNSNYSLTVNSRGRGSVTISPNENNYAKDTKVTLTATPSNGWVFSGWSGGATGNQNPLTITMNSRIDVTANFSTTTGKQDLILSGAFSSGTTNWIFNNWSGTGTGSIVNGEYKLTVSTVGDNYYDIQVVQPGITLEKGKTYRLMYDSYASSSRLLNVNVGMPDEPYTTFLTKVYGDAEANLTTTKKTYSFDFTMEAATYTNSRVEFSVGTDTPAVFIDNVSLFEVDPQVASLSLKNKGSLQPVQISLKGSTLNISVIENSLNRAYVSVYDLKGKVVYSTRLQGQYGNPQIVNINTTGMSSGYYVVKVQNKNFIQKAGILLTGK